MADRSEVPQQSPVHYAISQDGTAIAYERSGVGPPMIIVGGAFNDRTTAADLAAAQAVTPPRTRWTARSRISRL